MKEEDYEYPEESGLAYTQLGAGYSNSNYRDYLVGFRGVIHFYRLYVSLCQTWSSLMTLYGIEQSTDMRSKNTKIMRFATVRLALNWASAGGKPVDPGSMGEDNRKHHPSLVNGHKYIREVYDCGGSRISKSEAKKLMPDPRHHSMYVTTLEDCMASLIREKGIRLDK